MILDGSQQLASEEDKEALRSPRARHQLRVKRLLHPPDRARLKNTLGVATLSLSEFWLELMTAPSYFAIAVGGAPLNVLKEYIWNQEKPS